MKRGTIIRDILLSFFLFAFAWQMHAINGYKITLKSNVKHQNIYLYYQYGENRYPRDTAFTDGNGLAVFESTDSLTGGVFMLILTHGKALEFLMTEENNFGIETDTADILNKTSFIDHKENTNYYDFLKTYTFQAFQLNALKQKLQKESISADSVQRLKILVAGYEKQIERIKKKYIEQNPGTLLADLLSAQLPVDVPVGIRGQYRQLYIKRCFFDKVNFLDDKLAYSSVLLRKYTEYIQEYGFPYTDSVVACCDTILKKATASREIFKWSLYFLGNSFERSSVPGQDKIFVHIVDEYYKKGRCWWLTQAQINTICKRADVLRNLYTGSICPDFTAIDSSGKPVNLHKKITKKTVLYFWSYDCEHCLEETPKLAAWAKKHPEVNLITACILPDEDEWKNKLREFKLPGTHVIDTDNKANYISLYNLFSTPEIFVIDSEKKIRGKYLSNVKELDDFLVHQKIK